MSHLCSQSHVRSQRCPAGAGAAPHALCRDTRMAQSVRFELRVR